MTGKHIERFTTADGSTTLYDRELDVHYRSTHGANTESEAVFLWGTQLRQRDMPWRVLELGFGSGINFVQTVKALPDDGQLIYHSVEYAPVDPELLTHLEGESGSLTREALGQLAEAPYVHIESDDGRVQLHLHRCHWEALSIDQFQAQALFHDPFDPKINPTSWTTEAFEVAARYMDEASVLATYSAAGRVRRAMRDAGLFCATSPGPGRKREITFAARSRDALSHATIIEKYAPK